MFIGIDIGGTNIKGILSDKNGNIQSYKDISTPDSKEEIDISINKLIENLTTSVSVSKMDIQAIGIGSAGTIDRSKGIIISSPNIPYFKKYPLSKNIEKLTGIKVFLENDATTALIGAWWKGNGSKFRNWIMITLGTGIGGGIIIDNKIYTGKSGSAMEIGHMTIKFDGAECSCGNIGCFEKYASATALVELAEKNLKKNRTSSLFEISKNSELTAEIIFREASKNDEYAKTIFTEFSTLLGVGVANLVNIFNPEAIIFGGGLSQAHKMFLPIVKDVVSHRALPGIKENVKYFPIKDQSTIPALGAAKIAIDSVKED